MKKLGTSSVKLMKGFCCLAFLRMIDLRHRFFFVLLTVTAFEAFYGSKIARADSPKDILIIVNTSVPVERLSPDDVRNYFLKKLGRWKGGGRVVPINAKTKSRLRVEFRKRILNMNIDQETRYWQNRKIKAGQAKPREFGNTNTAVFRIKSSISYVYRSNYKENLAKVILVLPSKTSTSFKVIAHPDVPVDSINKKELKLIFTRKLTRWVDGPEIKPVDLTIDSDIRTNFTRAVHRKTLSALKNYWKREMFYGRNIPPPEKASDEHVVDYV
ncbi:MAG: hypothetical protein GY847_07100, partial [Proteobacteria bacterium]|nr:hypothetical protein [Pseudomonadota bacterium]